MTQRSRRSRSGPRALLLWIAPVALLALFVAPAPLDAAPEAPKGETVRDVDSRIVEVAVFASGALVTRSAEVDLDEGVQAIAFPKLPLAVDGSSLRAAVAPKSGLRILSVEARTEYGRAFRKEEAESMDKKVRDLEAKARGLTDREEVARRILDALARIEIEQPASHPPRPPALDPGPWARVLAKLREAMGGAYGSLEAAAVEERGLGEEIEGVRGEMARLRGYEVAGYGRAIVEVRAPGKGKAPVRITYFVPAACWVPAYAVRVDPDAGKLTIEATARVAQTTGEDWEGARLLFSTAVPTQAADLPKLASWRVREQVQPPPPAPAKPNESMVDQLLGGAREKGRSARAPKAPAQPGVAAEAPATGPALAPFVPMQPEAKKSLAKRDESDETGGATGRAPGAPSEPLGQEWARERLKDEKVASGTTADGRLEGAKVPLGRARGYLDSLSQLRSQIQAGTEGEVAARAPASTPSEPPLQRALASLAEAEGIAPPPSNYLKALAGGYDFVFEAPGAIPVPSDGQVHAIPLSSDTMVAAFSYEAVPAAIEYVFLSASGKNTRDAPLLAGNASIFSGGDFLGRTRLETLSPGEAFQVSLGVDEEVKVTHHVDEAQEDKGLLGGKRVTTATVEIKLKSFKKKPIDVVLRDRIPFSDAADLVIERRPPDPSPEEIGDGRGKEGRGVVRWKVSLSPGVERVVKLVYTMQRPKDTVLTYRERADMRGAR